MILPDTSVWVDHFRGKPTALSDPDLASQDWFLHPFIAGELLLGGLPKARNVREQLDSLRAAPVAEPSEAYAFIVWAKLGGTGIGYVDAHLLISARLLGAKLLTGDQDLHKQAERLGVAFAA